MSRATKKQRARVRRRRRGIANRKPKAELKSAMVGPKSAT
jgi:hypothetical protein